LATLHALGGAMGYMRRCLLDKAVLPLGRMAALPVAGPRARAVPAQPEAVHLDGSAFVNLEVGCLRTTRRAVALPAACTGGTAGGCAQIVENGEGGPAGTLLAALDHCRTAAGCARPARRQPPPVACLPSRA